MGPETNEKLNTNLQIHSFQRDTRRATAVVRNGDNADATITPNNDIRLKPHQANIAAHNRDCCVRRPATLALRSEGSTSIVSANKKKLSPTPHSVPISGSHRPTPTPTPSWCAHPQRSPTIPRSYFRGYDPPLSYLVLGRQHQRSRCSPSTKPLMARM